MFSEVYLERLTLAFAAGLERNGKPVRQYALVYVQHGDELTGFKSPVEKSLFSNIVVIKH